MNRIVKALRGFSWRLWLVLAVTLLVPVLYQTLRLYFLGELPGEWGVNIASQLAWVNLLYEVLEEALILPLFYLLGQSLTSKKELENKTRTGLLLCGGAYLGLSALIAVFARPLCVWMASDPATLDATVAYIRLESAASALGILSQFITVLLVTLNKERYMYLLLGLRTGLSMLLDTFLLSKLPFSADLGVNGIAFSNIAVSALCAAASFLFLNAEGIRVFRREKLDFHWLREYGRIGAYSGLESLVRNLAFMLMVSRLVNVISEAGTYWVANSFIWTWLLLPANALYDVVKKETAEAKENIRSRTPGYLLVAALFCLLWLSSIPLWRLFIRYVLNSGSCEKVLRVALLSTPFYLVYIFNCVFDGTIYGRGRTEYMLYESLFTNGLYYTAMYFLWRGGRWIPTLDGIALMFGFGMAFDLLPTLWCYFHLLKQENISPGRPDKTLAFPAR